MAITSGQLKASNLTASTTATGASGTGVAPDQRSLFNFSDRIAELAPEESPFFVYLSKTAKLPTDDSLFRYLEDRSKISYTSREFFIKGAVGTVVAGTNYNVTVETATSGGASVDFLVKGMVIAVRTIGNGSTDAGYGNAILRIESAVSDNGADSSFTAKCISVSGVSGSNNIADEDRCQIQLKFEWHLPTVIHSLIRGVDKSNKSATCD